MVGGSGRVQRLSCTCSNVPCCQKLVAMVILAVKRQLVHSSDLFGVFVTVAGSVRVTPAAPS